MTVELCPLQRIQRNAVVINCSFGLFNYGMCWLWKQSIIGLDTEQIKFLLRIFYFKRRFTFENLFIVV